MFIELNKPTNFKGYKVPEKIEVNDKLDIYLYMPVDLTGDYMIGLHRKFNFDLTEPFLLRGATLFEVLEKLYERGLS